MALARHKAVETVEPDLTGEISAPRQAGRTTARMTLLVAVWVGLTAGFADAAAVVVHRRWIEHDFLRLGGDFVWLIPLGVTSLVLAPAVVLALIVWSRHGAVRPGTVAGLLGFVGFLDVSARFPLAVWAAFLLSGGLAAQLARLVNRHSSGFARLIRWTVPPLAGLLAAAVLVTIGGRAWAEYRARAALPQPPPDARNVLLIVWDTVRFQNMSLNGYDRPTTPFLASLVRRGARFDHAFSTSSWTLPSHASLFTGLWPHELGVDWKSPMRRDVPTLAGFLAAHGYDTAGFAANVEYCNIETGLGRGFAHFEDYPIDLYDVFTRYVALTERIDLTDCACIVSGLIQRVFGRWYDFAPRSTEHVKSAEAVDQSFLTWLSRRGKGRPFFAFLNYNDAHTPYEVPDRRTAAGFGLRPASPWDRMTLHHWMTRDKSTLTHRDVRMAVDSYDDCIAYLDRRLEALFGELARRGVLDNTLVVFTTDHGEHLGDHMLFFHGCSLYRELVQVSMALIDPGRVPANGVVSNPVSLRDIPATVVDLLGLGSGHPFPGGSLARFWNVERDEKTSADEPVFMETTTPLLLANGGREPAARGPIKSIVAGGSHYILNGDGSEELYALEADPRELMNLAGSPLAGEVLQRFRDRLAALLSGRR